MKTQPDLNKKLLQRLRGNIMSKTSSTFSVISSLNSEQGDRKQDSGFEAASEGIEVLVRKMQGQMFLYGFRHVSVDL